MRITDLNTPAPLAPNLSIPSSTHSNAVQTSQTSTEIPFYRSLGRTDLQVSCLGIGGGGAIASEDILYAFDQGINYFFFSSDLHHHLYSTMTPALRQLCGRQSSQREKVVLATVTYIKQPEMAMAALLDQFGELGIDYVDVFFWGWVDEGTRESYTRCMELSPDLRGPGTVYQRNMERIIGVSERLKKMGAVRYVGTSFHSLDMAQEWLHSPFLDVVMVRHNPAHRMAQGKIFNSLTDDDPTRPGIITFKSAGFESGPLWRVPDALPKTCVVPSVPDLYRYSLSQNCVDLCLAGLRQRSEIDAALQGIRQGKLATAELDYFNLYGDLHRNRVQIQDVAPERLLHRPVAA